MGDDWDRAWRERSAGATGTGLRVRLARGVVDTTGRYNWQVQQDVQPLVRDHSCLWSHKRRTPAVHVMPSTDRGHAGAGFEVIEHELPEIPRLTITVKHGILQKVALNFLSLRQLSIF